MDGVKFGREVVTNKDIVLGAFLGQGVSSVVRAAKDLRNPKIRYAVKIMNVYDEGKRHQLMKEVRVLFALDCNSLVFFHGAYLDDGGRVGVILEYMDGGALENVLEKHHARARAELSFPGLPEHVMAAIFFQIVWGLAYLHYEHRLHRDIKPGNVLLNLEGEAKLSDFGIARDMEGDEAVASTMVGTFRYMSPERLHGRDYAFHSDVWSVGVMLCEAARGEALFPAKATPVDLVQAFKTQGNNLVPQPRHPRVTRNKSLSERRSGS